MKKWDIQLKELLWKKQYKKIVKYLIKDFIKLFINKGLWKSK